MWAILKLCVACLADGVVCGSSTFALTTCCLGIPLTGLSCLGLGACGTGALGCLGLGTCGACGICGLGVPAATGGVGIPLGCLGGMCGCGTVSIIPAVLGLGTCGAIGLPLVGLLTIIQSLGCCVAFPAMLPLVSQVLGIPAGELAEMLIP
jgi:hypothetical protein